VGDRRGGRWRRGRDGRSLVPTLTIAETAWAPSSLPGLSPRDTPGGESILLFRLRAAGPTAFQAHNPVRHRRASSLDPVRGALRRLLYPLTLSNREEARSTMPAVSALLHQAGLVLFAVLLSARTSGPEVATRGRVRRGGKLTSQDDPSTFPLLNRIWDGDGREQGVGVGVARVV
jgi:hypothetical protein